MSYSKQKFSHVVRTLASVFAALTLSPAVLAQSSGYSILTTTPFPLNPNVPGSVTLRLSAAGTQFPNLLFCEYAFNPNSMLSAVVSEGVITVKHRRSPAVPPLPGSERYCDKTFPLPALSAGHYFVRLDIGTEADFGIPESASTIDLRLICVGSCPTQSVPLNFSAGAPLWWFAIASLFGLGGYVVRRREGNRRR